VRARVGSLKALAAAAVVALLVLPSGALATGRAVSFNARIVRVSSLGVVLRRAGGRTVRVAASQITRVPGGVSASGGAHAPLAHMSGDLRGVVGALEGLAPGLVVRVTRSAGAAGRPSVALTLPSGIGPARHARGVVSSVFQSSFLLDGAGGLELRLRGHTAGLHVCDGASVVYHQNHVTLVADRVRDAGRASCAR